MKLERKNKKVKITQKNYRNREWKEKNKLYLRELQSFFDIVDNVQDCELKQKIISQMLFCDKTLTEIAEEKFEAFYEQGYKDAKDG